MYPFPFSNHMTHQIRSVAQSCPTLCNPIDCNLGEGNGTPLQYPCLENPMDGGAWLSDFTFTFHFHALEKEMATHSSVVAWRIPGTGEPGGLLSMGSHRVGHDSSDLAAAAAYICYCWGCPLLVWRGMSRAPLQALGCLQVTLEPCLSCLFLIS